MWLEASAFDLAERWGWVGLKRCRRRFGPTLPHGFLRKTRSSARGWRCWWRRRWTFAASTSWSWPPPCRARPSGWTCATNGSAGCSATRASTSKPWAPYAREVLARACAGSRALVVIIDQSKVNDAHHMVMVSLRVGERALPLAWRVKKTQGAIGFREQRDALATVAALLPEGVRPTLLGDRFYGSPALIAWCRDHGWGWRLRCKQDLLVFDNGG